MAELTSQTNIKETMKGVQNGAKKTHSLGTYKAHVLPVKKKKDNFEAIKRWSKINVVE
jgi:hypothetical protein